MKFISISVLVALLSLLFAITLRFFMGEMDLTSFIVASATFPLFPTIFPGNSDESRAFFRKNVPAASNVLHGVHTQDYPIPNALVVRVYSSSSSSAGGEDGLKPILVFVHGGGFVLGNVNTTNDICSSFAHLSNGLVMSIGYRLAPEYKFPIPLEDVQTSFQWIEQHAAELGGDVRQVSVMGESAGGNLAAALTAVNIHKQLTHIQIKHLFLVYPCIEQGSIRESNFKHRNANGMLTFVQMQWFWAQYLGDVHDRHDYRASLLLTPPEVLHAFPPTTLLLAEFDVLRDEGVAFGELLRSHGVPVDITVYNSTIHVFFGRFGEAGMDSLQKTVDIFTNKKHI